MNTHPGIQPSEHVVSEYKTILQKVLENRPSGMRQRLAKAIGKNPSFISQISNPGYNTPIPYRHLKIIFDICHFSTEERESFEAAYKRAHPGRTKVASKSERTIKFTAPDLGSEKKNEQFDQAVQEFVSKLSNLMKNTS